MRTTRRTTRAVAACSTAAALMVTACGGTDSGSSASTAGFTTVGVSVQNATNPFFGAENTGAKHAAGALGVTAKIQDGGQDVAKQASVIDTFVQQGVHGIVIDAVDTAAIGPAIKRAQAKKIPVVAIDVAAAGADATLTTDNVQAGKVSCEHLGKALAGKGAVAILDGTAISAVAERVQGCKDALKAYPGIKVVAQQRGDNGRDKGLAVATDVLTANPEVKGFFAINDPTAAGVELAAKQKGRNDIVITSVDGAPDAIQTIKNGGLIKATAAQDPIGMGKRGVEIARDIAHGKPPAQKVQLMPTTLVTSENADTYKGWG
jgi:ribose transport system substrate-binding protein